MPERDDLVRVDLTGTLHPVGKSASQELRARAGEWRLERGPPGSILLGRAARGEGEPVLKLAGKIRTPGALCDIVAMIAQCSWKGELIAIEDNKVRSVYFESGSVLGANTNVPDERLGETLYRFGVVTREQIDSVVKSSAGSGRRFGEAAIELDYVTPERLYPMMARQVEEVFYAAVQIGDGTFYFYDRFDEALLGRRHNLNASMLLMEGARRMDEMRFFRERVPNEHYIPAPRETGKKPPDELVKVLAECDGKQNISQIGRRLGLLEFEVTRAVFQLASGGFVVVAAPRAQGPQAIMEGFNPALIEIHASCDASGKGAELRDGLSRFATGGGVYDPLFQGAGPLSDGTLKPERVERNLAALAGDDPDAWLTQLMLDYIGFALFQAGSLLPRDAEARLSASVGDRLQPLRPLESSPLTRGA